MKSQKSKHQTKGAGSLEARGARKGKGGRDYSRTRSQPQPWQLPRRGREGNSISELRFIFRDMARHLGTLSLASMALASKTHE